LRREAIETERFLMEKELEELGTRCQELGAMRTDAALDHRIEEEIGALEATIDQRAKMYQEHLNAIADVPGCHGGHTRTVGV